MPPATAALFYASLTGTAAAETRTLSIYHTHSKEAATITFKRDGQYDRAGLDQLNHILRDWRTDDKISMDPHLFDVVWQVCREVGSNEPIHIVSAYRAPSTNALLRRRSRAVAEQSQHMLGKAMDFFLTDVPVDKVRAAAMRLQGGGVGYYPSSQNAFVHLDVGSVRAWPRMTHDQLARLFPDGKTVHLPKDGTPLARYEEAKAEILARGGAVSGVAYAQAEDDGAATKRFWAKLFGGGADEAEDRETARGAGRSSTKPVLAALAKPDDSSSSTGLSWLDRLTGKTEPEPRLVTGLPIPVRRPAANESGKLALVPLPPRRPANEAGTSDGNASEPERNMADKVVADVPVPPLRPGRTRREAPTVASRIDAIHDLNPVYASQRTVASLYVGAVTGTVAGGKLSFADGKVRVRAEAPREAGAIAGDVPKDTAGDAGRLTGAPAKSSSSFLGFSFR